MSGDIPSWPRNPAHAPRVLAVGELARIARIALEDRFPDVWVEGELSDVSRPASGHVYFTLSDSNAQVRGVMYRNDAQRSRARLLDGVKVRLRGSLSLYEARGSFQPETAIEPPRWLDCGRNWRRRGFSIPVGNAPCPNFRA
jgi:exodeoxyribonuclease VII large subunit